MTKVKLRGPKPTTKTKPVRVSVDVLLDKHEHYPVTTKPVQVRVGSEAFTVSMPTDLPDVDVMFAAPCGKFLVLLGKRLPWKGLVDYDPGDGVLLVAAPLPDGTHVVRVWHELYSWALRDLELVAAGRAMARTPD